MTGMDSERRGLSVLEVIIAIAVIAIAGLGIIATLTRIMVSQSTSSHETVGRLVAESVLQRAVLAGPDEWGIPDPPDWGSSVTKRSATQTVEAMVGQNDGPTEYLYYVEVIEVSNQNESGDGMFGVDADPTLTTMGVLWEVKVTLWWNADASGPQAAVERGTQRLSVSKVVYIEI